MKTIITAYADPEFTLSSEERWTMRRIDCGGGPVFIAYNPESQVLKIDGAYVDETLKGCVVFSAALLKGGERSGP